jgi:preprotein translocase subunit SecG
MQMVVLSIHLLVCLCLVGLVLLQRSEGGALGMGGGGGSLVSGRGAADALAKMTSVAGGFFLVTSLSLTFLSGAAASASSRSVFDMLPRQERTAPAPAAPAQPAPTTPDPTESSAPEAAQTQLASLAPAQTTAAPTQATPVAPPPVQAATRAGPLDARPQQTAARQPAASTTTATTTQRAPTTTPATTRQPQSGQPRTTNASTPGTQSAPNRPLVLPNTSGSATTGLTTAAPTEPESVEVVNGVEAVRRERAGPDQ